MDTENIKNKKNKKKSWKDMRGVLKNLGEVTI